MKPTKRKAKAVKAPAAAEWIALSRLRRWPGNPRKNAEAVRPVADSIIRFGWGAVLLARRDTNELVAGDTRYQAAEMLIADYKRSRGRRGATWHPEAVHTAATGEVPVRFGDWNDKEARLLAIADNKIGEIATWDEEQLAEILREHSVDDARVAGYDAEELQALLEQTSEDHDGGSGDPQLGGDLTYQVVVECTSEEHQAEVLEQLQADGLSCKPLVV